MRRGRHSFCGIIAIAAGIIIIMSLVLPSQFWWFVLAGCLIAFGVWLLRC